MHRISVVSALIAVVAAGAIACGPSPSSARPALPATAAPVELDAPPETGLLGQKGAPVPSGVFTPSNAWAGWIDARTYVQVWAGLRPEADGGGTMLIMRRPGIGDGLHLDPNGTPTLRYVSPATPTGALSIVDVQGGRLLVRDPNGSASLFDPVSAELVPIPD